MGKTRKGSGGRVGEKPRKIRTSGIKNIHAGSVIWCDNCRTKGVHKRVGDVARCYDRQVSEGIDFSWVR